MLMSSKMWCRVPEALWAPDASRLAYGRPGTWGHALAVGVWGYTWRALHDHAPKGEEAPRGEADKDIATREEQHLDRGVHQRGQPPVPQVQFTGPWGAEGFRPCHDAGEGLLQQCLYGTAIGTDEHHGVDASLGAHGAYRPQRRANDAAQRRGRAGPIPRMCSDVAPIAVTHVHGNDGPAHKVALLERRHGLGDPSTWTQRTQHTSACFMRRDGIVEAAVEDDDGSLHIGSRGDEGHSSLALGAILKAMARPVLTDGRSVPGGGMEWPCQHQIIDCIVTEERHPGHDRGRLEDEPEHIRAGIVDVA